jgi:7-cyano-7-deazaguanine synthase in queuosine biosynthesis
MEALLYSGGLDSSCMFWVLDKPKALYCGGLNGPARNANSGELTAILTQRELSREFDLQFTGVLTDFTPFMKPGEWRFPRDTLSCILAWTVGFNKVLLGWCKNDRAILTGVQEQTKRLAEAVGFPEFKVEAPLWYMTKAELIVHALNKGANSDFLLASHSCVRESVAHCGDCVNCVERYLAFKSARVEDTTEYLVHPQKSGAMKELKKRHKEDSWFWREYADCI